MLTTLLTIAFDAFLIGSALVTITGIWREARASQVRTAGGSDEARMPEPRPQRRRRSAGAPGRALEFGRGQLNARRYGRPARLAPSRLI